MGKIVVTRIENAVVSAVFEENEMTQVSVSKFKDANILGNIYLGKVQNIIKNIGAAFVEIEGKRACYLPLEKNECPVFANPKNDGKLRVGDEIIVQVVKEDKNTKAPVLSAMFSLTGKYVVLVHGKKQLGISAKITDDAKRKSLRGLIKPYIGDDFGFIVRTNALGVSDELIEREVRKLIDDYKLLLRFGVHWNVFSKLYSSIPQYLWDVRDCFDGDIEEIKTDDEEIYKEMRDFMAETNKDELDKITLYTDESISLDKIYGISSKLKKATEKIVWLDSGGYIVIEPTEALVSVDVNTGRAVSKKTNPEETFLKINKEAAVMIAKQIKLRNLSGMILVDFIDMKSEEHKTELIDKFVSELHKDRIHTTFVDMTKLGLVEITRKKVKKPLYEQIELIE